MAPSLRILRRENLKRFTFKYGGSKELSREWNKTNLITYVNPTICLQDNDNKETVAVE